MKRNPPIFLALAMGLATLAASGAALAPATPLIEDGPMVVDAADFEGNMLRIPENRRSEFRTGYDRVATVVDNIFIARNLAARARQAGLDKDPAVQRRLQQLQEGLLADLYVQKLEKEAPAVNLEQRAREVFKLEQARMTKPEEVYVQHILIGLNGRTREMAAERAKEVYAKAKAPGADFLALADKYSDDPDKRRNGGDLGYNSPNAFVPPVRDAITKLTRKGDVSQPIESELGFHIIRFVDRKPPQPAKFEDVKDKLMQAEKEKINRARVDALVQEIRGSKTVVVHRENVEKLVVPVDPKELERKAAEAAAAPTR
ncbi:MAG TPA: peptidylprolyl isomerase [Usitatibacter sp.]|nr:peptidylprolyl isomerase [Usitatibacter sp.]